MKLILQKEALKTLLTLVMAISFSASWGQLSITTANSTVTQNFDGLPSSGSGLSQTGGIFANGWSFVEGGSNLDAVYNTGTGSSTTGNTYSFGSSSASDRAFGMLQSGSLTSILGLKFINNTGSTITSLVIGYTGEVWRLSAAADNIAFSYQSGSVGLNAGSGWTTVGGLAFTTPVTGAAAPVDGNAAVNRTVIAPVTISVNIPNGTTYTLRWVDATGSSSAGMGIDDFSIKLVPASTTVTTTAATAIGLNSATLNGSINPNGYTVDGSFEYGTTVAYGNTVASTTGITGASPVSISGTVASGLTVNTQYNFRAVGTVVATPTNGNNLTFYTLANAPAVPVVGNPTLTTLDVSLNDTAENGNPAITQYAIQEAGGNYVQANGTLGAAAVWQTALAWGTKTVTGLSNNTTYTFQVKARNGSNVETGFGSTSNGTTLQNLSANITIVNALSGFGSLCTNASVSHSFTFDGANLDGSDIVVNALAGYSYSLSQNGIYTPTLNISYAGNSISGNVVWVQFSPSAVQPYNGNISLTGGNLSVPFNVGATGSGINTQVTVTTGAVSGTTSTSVVLGGSVLAGCTAVSPYGIEYSTTNGFSSGTQVASTNLTSGAFSATVSGLNPNTTYYYKAYAIDGNAVTVYGAQKSFITNNIDVPIAVAAGGITSNEFTANWNAVAGATSYRLDVSESATFGTTSLATLSQNFTAYTNATSFNGFALTGTSNYSTAGSSGTSGPNSVQFNDTGDRVVTPLLPAAATQLSFWIKGNSTNAASALLVEGYNGTSWTTIQNITSNIPTTGTTITYNSGTTPVLPSNIVQFRFTYTKSNGNVAFDDVAITYNTFAPSFVSGYGDLPVNGTSQVVSGLTEFTNYYYRVRAVSANSTSANSNVITVKTLPAPPTFGAIAQVVAVVCDGSDATFNVTGLLPNSTSAISFNIDGGATQSVTGVTSNPSGFATFDYTLSFANNGKLLTVTSVERTDLASIILTVSSGNTTTLSVHQNVTYYADADADGFGNPGVTTVSCAGIPAGYVANNTDCNDAVVYYQDTDGDGFGSTVKLACGTVTNNTDCNDNQTQYRDADGDGFGSATMAACGVSNNTDCDDSDNTKNASFLFYTDADNDGYGAGNAVAVCAVNASSVPAGFSAEGTDCDDTKSTVHPNAAEIGYNLIDDDCDGSIDEGFPPKATVIQGCNYTLSAIDSYVYANLVAGAQGYRWRVTTMTGPNSNQVQFINTSLRALKLTQLGSYAFNTTYKIEVAVYYAGFLQPYTASSCTVNTPMPVGQLVSCGQTLTATTDVIYANQVSFGTGYRFRVTDPANPLIYQILDRSLREFRMNLITNFAVQYGKAYNVEVAVKNTDGSYLPYGPICNVSTPLFPTTSLEDAQCNDYAVPNMNTQIYASSYPGAVSYVFNLTGPGLPAAGVEVVKSLRAFKLGDFTGLIPGATYNVKVRMIFNDADLPGPYGKTCTVVVPAISRMIAAEFSAVAYPNPFAENFSIEVKTSAKATVELKVYDMTGRLLDSRKVTVSEIESLKVGDGYPSGIYNVIVTQGDVVKSLRVIKR